MADAPPAFIEAQLRGIVGVETEIRVIDGKWNVSQNRAVADRNGVVAGLAESGHAAMAALVQSAPQTTERAPAWRPGPSR